MFNVRLAGGHLYGKQLFTWLSLVMSFMASFVLSFFPLDVLDGIWDLIESVSEGFLTYSLIWRNPYTASNDLDISKLMKNIENLKQTRKNLSDIYWRIRWYSIRYDVTVWMMEFHVK